MSEADKAVEKSGEAWDFDCPRCEFSSTGHETKKRAAARGAQHLDEHDGGETTPELAVFRDDQTREQ